MAFDAGAIVGKLGLDVSEFTSGILQAQSISSIFPDVVTNFLANPLLGVAGLLKDGAGFIIDTVKEIGHEFDDMGESAEKVGVSTEFLSAVGRLASDAGSSVEGLGVALKFLGNNAADAAGGNKTAVQAFADLNISVTDAAGKLKSNESLFFEVADAISRIADPAQKTQAAMNLMGRGGTDLIPTLNQGAAGIKSWITLMDQLGATITAEEAKSGDSFGRLGSIIDATWDGVKQKLAFPILQYLDQHAEEILPKIIQAATAVGDAIPVAFAKVESATKSLANTLETLKPVWNVLKIPYDFLVGVGQKIGENVGATVGNLQNGDPYGQDRYGSAAEALKAKGITINYDPKESVNQMAERIVTTIEQNKSEADRRWDSAFAAAQAAHAVGGSAGN